MDEMEQKQLVELQGLYEDAKEEMEVAIRVFKAREEAKLRSRMRKFIRPYFRAWHPDRISAARLQELKERAAAAAAAATAASAGAGGGNASSSVSDEAVRDSIASVLNFLTAQQDRFMEKE